MESGHNTSYTLLHRALDLGDDEAWERLVEHYKRFIYYVLHGLNANPSDIDDLTQQVLVRVLNSLKRYDKSRGSFRTWLITIIRNTAVSQYQKNASEQRRIDRLEVEGGFGSGSQSPEIDAFIEKEWSTYIATEAMARVRSQSRSQAVEVFELALEGLCAAEIAEKTGLTLASVYSLKKKAKRLIYLEILELTAHLEP
ncbi:RNA polymerase sigma factor [Pontiella sulfatireligans]|uniref:RNA polymerase sigma factor n=1 Tax=Pontiella sulfatireligans TaxID=2750658 RepID=A0A6C2UGP0_9BACT|nr:sigma-70 family RNA polymerase sigma factor [Pontiella sulfatireligans]VGO18534.1 ECF RNA polymerase sigma factor SigE [Pontiella sulfatireligans]